MTRQMTVVHNGKTYAAEVWTIKSTFLGVEDHGIMTANLGLVRTAQGISVGGYALDGWSEVDKRRRGADFGMDHVMRIIETVGAPSWERLPGREVVLLFDGTGSTLGLKAVGIAHITDENRVFIFKEHADLYKDEK